jgi:hypothetical protein
MRAKLEDSDRGKKLIVSELEPFDGKAFRKPPEVLPIRTDAGVLVNGRREKLVHILEHYPGQDIVELHVTDEDGNMIVARMQQTVDCTAQGLYAELIELFGGDAIAQN